MTGTNRVRFRIGDWVLNTELNRLEGGGGEVKALEPLAAELLEFLARHPGRVLSVDDMLAEVWTGRVVTDSSVYRLVADLRKALGDRAQSPRYIETVRKRGYRLVADVGAIAESNVAADDRPPAPASRIDSAEASMPDPLSGQPGRSAQRQPVPWRIALPALALAVLALALLATRDTTPVVGPTADDIIIAVLPPEPLSDTTPGFLVDGLGNAISTRLAAIQALSVVAYSSARAAALRSDDLQNVAGRLNADLLLASTVLASEDQRDNRVRLTLSLISADDSVQLWSRQFQTELGDIFELYDTIAGDIARELDLRVAVASREASTLARLSDPQLVADYMRAQNQLMAGYQNRTLYTAVDHLDNVLAASPDFAPALAARAVVHLRLFSNYHDRSEQRLQRARRDVEQALQLEPGNAESFYALGYLRSEEDDVAQAIEMFSRAIELQPSHSRAHMALAKSHARAGSIEPAIVMNEAAVRLDPLNALYHYELGLLQLNSGRFAAADSNLAKASSLSPEMIEPYIYRAWAQIVWRADTTAANAHLQHLADVVGESEMMQVFMTAGLWGIFTWTDPALDASLAKWSVDESGGDPAVWHLAMAEVALKRGDAAAKRHHMAAAAEQREKDVEAVAESPWLHAELAIARAGIGQRAESLQAADKAIALSPVSDDEWDGVDFLWVKATVFAMLGDHESAIEQVRVAAQYPSLVTPNALRVDRNWDALFENPEFTAMMSDDGAAWRVPPAP